MEAGPADPVLAVEPESPGAAARALLNQVVPGVLVGALSAVTLLALSVVAGALEAVLWDWLPLQLGIEGTSPLWTIGMLTAVGLAAGLVVTVVPGHAGPDPATTELTAPPLPIGVLPGLAVAVLITLAGGVSLGPENPIIAINVGLAVALGLRLAPSVPVPAWAGLAVAGTLGAMFGTPVGAALALSEMASRSSRPLWERIFGPLVAAAAGALTMDLLAGESFVLDVQPYTQPVLIDVVTGSLLAAGSAALAMVVVYAFPVVHRLVRRLGPPLVTLVVGGFLLGVLGVIGGPLTMFKGLDEMQELTATVDAYAAPQLLALSLIKFAAVLVAGTTGFRGGRIFPSVFAAVALGLFVSVAVPAIPQTVALAGCLMGVLVAVTRSGWLSIFMVALMLGEAAIVPLCCVYVLAAWVVVAGRPEMVVPSSEAIVVPERDGAPAAVG